MTFPSFDKRYWWFIAAILFVHIVTIALTWYAITYQNAVEVNPLLIAGFTYIGIIPSLMFLIVIDIVVLIGLPFVMNETHWGIKTTLSYTGLLAGISFDFLNDFLMLIRHPLSAVTIRIFHAFYAVMPIVVSVSLIIIVGYYFVCHLKKKNKLNAEQRKSTASTHGQH